MADRDPPLGKLCDQGPQCEIGRFAHPRQPPMALALERVRPPASHRLGPQPVARNRRDHFTTLATLTPKRSATARQVCPLATAATTRLGRSSE